MLCNTLVYYFYYPRYKLLIIKPNNFRYFLIILQTLETDEENKIWFKPCLISNIWTNDVKIENLKPKQIYFLKNIAPQARRISLEIFFINSLLF